MSLYIKKGRVKGGENYVEFSWFFERELCHNFGIGVKPCVVNKHIYRFNISMLGSP